MVSQGHGAPCCRAHGCGRRPGLGLYVGAPRGAGGDMGGRFGGGVACLLVGGGACRRGRVGRQCLGARGPREAAGAGGGGGWRVTGFLAECRVPQQGWHPGLMGGWLGGGGGSGRGRVGA